MQQCRALFHTTDNKDCMLLQDFVNSRLQDVDRLVSELMEECQRYARYQCTVCHAAGILLVYGDIVLKICLVTSIAMCRKQQALERKTRLLKSLTSTQQQMEDMSGRIAACSTSIQAVKQQTSNI